MDYSLFTEEIIRERLENLPDNLRTMAESGNTIRAVRQIARIHYLDEQRMLILEQLVGLTILGFLSLDELSLEISERLHLNYDHSSALAKELKVRVFRPVKDDLEAIYSPVELQDTEHGIQDTGMEIEEETALGEIKITEDEDKRQATSDKRQVTDAPMILHEETPIVAEKKPSQPKSFTVPFGFFKSKTAAPTGEAVKVRVETNEIRHDDHNNNNDYDKTKKEVKKSEDGFTKDGKRVVHYSELRTALTPFGNSEDIINLETLTNDKTNRSNESNGSNRTDITPTVSTPVVIPEEPRERTKGFWFFKTNMKPKQKDEDQGLKIKDQETVATAVATGQPKVEGNTIDLR